MNKSTAVSSSGTSASTLLLVLFIGLKLTHYIDWSWKWVLAPLWIPFAIVLLIMLFAVLMAFATGQVKIVGKNNKKTRN